MGGKNMDSENSLQTMVNFTAEEATIDGRELHKFLEVKTKYDDWFPRMCEYGFVEGEDFNFLKKEKVQVEGKRKVTRQIRTHLLTIEMAKELCMIQRNEKGKMARKYFIEVEKAWNDPVLIMGRALKVAESKLQSANKTIATLTPKADFYDAVANTDSCLSMEEVAKILNIKAIGRNTLFWILRYEKILQDGCNKNIPYQKYMKYFKLAERKYITSEGKTKIKTQTRVNQKGVDFIRKLVTEWRDREIVV